MKHLKKLLFTLLIVFTINSLQAQDKNNPWAISLGTNAVDFYPTNHPSILNASGASAGWLDQYFNAEDHYNFSASPLSRIHVGRYIGEGFSLGGALSFNSIDQVGVSSVDELIYIGLDMDIKYNLNNAFGDLKWFDPYVHIGGGYTFIGDDDGAGTLNGGLGFNLWLSEFFGLNVQSNYKHSFDDDRVLPHFQHSLGVIFKFGGIDTDGDGIYDKNDACPEVVGLVAFEGCPDSDSDGIKDSADDCPLVAGLTELNGCPDKDGDGIADKDDACPEVVGTKANNGCPDTDGDGVIDGKDDCPKVKGPKANNGCPDTDGDGILDKDDDCPKEVGVASNKGCPEVVIAEPVPVITVEAAEQLKNYAKTIYFKSGKSTFKTGVSEKLDAIYEIMASFPKANFNIGGHTDSQGGAALNQKLSDKRANAVKDYLVSKGLAVSRLSAYGFGEEHPIDTNKTSLGRSHNRRVEINLVK
ncbi:MAG: OmpA family protein [Flavobacteriaceae bacterium]|nr:OmpA family protein [Flavobacteriaceae bacterium]